MRNTFPNAQFRIENGHMFGDELEMFIYGWSGLNGREQFVVDPVTIRKRTPEEEAMRIPPALVVSTDSAQQLMDELWRVGLRPSEGSGSAGSLAATQAHLKDMRGLVSKLLKCQL